jgi:hypothetical protein
MPSGYTTRYYARCALRTTAFTTEVAMMEIVVTDEPGDESAHLLPDGHQVLYMVCPAGHVHVRSDRLVEFLTARWAFRVQFYASEFRLRSQIQA